MAINRAIQLTAAQGDPYEVFELKTIPKPKASGTNVVVRVVLRPVNPCDLLLVRQGYWAHVDLSKAVVGGEGVGVVDEVGEGVSKVKVGQRVIPLVWNRYVPIGYGVWRDYVEVPEMDLVAVPDNISDTTAAQFIVNPWTAYGILKELDIPKGGYFLQTAGASVVGRQLIALAKHYGIKSINVVRRDAYIQPLKDLGADYVINSTTEVFTIEVSMLREHLGRVDPRNMKSSCDFCKICHWRLDPHNMKSSCDFCKICQWRLTCNTADVKAKVMEITGGKGAYGGADAVAGEATRAVASSLRDGGKVLIYGTLSATHVMLDVVDLVRKVSLAFFQVQDFSHDLPRREETISAVLKLLSSKIIDPFIGNTYPLEEFKEAMKETERAAHGGKAFLSSY